MNYVFGKNSSSSNSGKNSFINNCLSSSGEYKIRGGKLVQKIKNVDLKKQTEEVKNCQIESNNKENQEVDIRKKSLNFSSVSKFSENESLGQNKSRIQENIFRYSKQDNIQSNIIPIRLNRNEKFSESPIKLISNQVNWMKRDVKIEEKEYTLNIQSCAYPSLLQDIFSRYNKNFSNYIKHHTKKIRQYGDVTLSQIIDYNNIVEKKRLEMLNYLNLKDDCLLPDHKLIDMFINKYQLKKSLDLELMPLPSKGYTLDSNNKDHRKFYNCERNTVAIRRNEYTKRIRSWSRYKEFMKSTSKEGFIVYIQRTWKKYFNNKIKPCIIYIQQKFRLFIFRKGINKILLLIGLVCDKFAFLENLLLIKKKKNALLKISQYKKKVVSIKFKAKIYKNPPYMRKSFTIEKKIFFKESRKIKTFLRKALNKIKSKNEVRNKKPNILNPTCIRSKIHLLRNSFLINKQRISRIILKLFTKDTIFYYYTLKHYFKSKVLHSFISRQILSKYENNCKSAIDYIKLKADSNGKLLNRLSKDFVRYSVAKMKKDKEIYSVQAINFLKRIGNSISYYFISRLRKERIKKDILKDLLLYLISRRIKYNLGKWYKNMKFMKDVIYY